MAGNDWKVRLKYGLTHTPYKHYTLLADVLVGNDLQGFTCAPGRAWVGNEGMGGV